MAKLTHLDKSGDLHMVDVAPKPHTHRVAVAEGMIQMAAATLKLIRTGGHVKGDVLAVAKVAGIMAAKRTAELVPLCHPLALSRIDVTLSPRPASNSVHCVARAECIGPTGVEMEALTAVQVALLTVYDMCKAADRGMTMTSIRLLEKSGGQSGRWKRDTKPPSRTRRGKLP